MVCWNGYRTEFTCHLLYLRQCSLQMDTTQTGWTCERCGPTLMTQCKLLNGLEAAVGTPYSDEAVTLSCTPSCPVTRLYGLTHRLSLLIQSTAQPAVSSFEMMAGPGIHQRTSSGHLSQPSIACYTLLSKLVSFLCEKATHATQSHITPDTSARGPWHANQCGGPCIHQL